MRGRAIRLASALFAIVICGVGVGGAAPPAATGSAEASVSGLRNGRLMVVAAVDRRQRDWFVDFFPDGSHVRRASTADMELFGTEYSPDGRSLVVFANNNESLSRSQIYRARADGSGLRRLTSGPNDWAPTWSPNGRRIAFVRTYELIVMRADGTRRHAIFPTSQVESVTWAADGRLVFSSWFDFERSDFMDRPDLWSVRPDGSDLQRLTDTDQVAEYVPDPSPRADVIAYEHRAGGGGPITVHLMNADGTNDRELVAGSAPEWSPDGHWVAYASSTPESYSTIGFIRPDGSGGRTLALDNAIPDAPTWRAKLTFSWQPWPGTTPSHLREFRVRQDRGRTVFTGRVVASLPGHRVRATLRRPTGEGQVVALRDVLTQEEGRFRVVLPRTGRSTCELTVRYGGDAAHLPSRRTVDVSC